MKQTILILVALFAVFALTTRAQDSTVSVISLEEAIEIGLRSNYDIQIARNSARIGQINRGRGTAGFLPTFDVNANYRLSNTDETTNSPFSLGSSDVLNYGATASLNWTLFDGFKMFVDKKRYDELALLSSEQARDAIERTVVVISRAYLNVVQQQQLLEVARENRDISGDRLEREEVRNELGGSTGDLLNARVAFNSDQSLFLTQELQVATARELLNELLGRDPSSPISVSRDIALPPLGESYDDIFQAALDSSATLRAAELNQRVAEREVQASRSPFLPKIGLSASYAYSDRTITREQTLDDVTTESKEAAIGLTLSYNIFNGGRDRIAYRNARILANNASFQLHSTRNALAGDIREAYETLQQRLQVVGLEEENVVTAQRSLDLQSERYELGASSSLDFRDAQVSLARARIALIVARFQARIARLELDRLTGNIGIDT